MRVTESGRRGTVVPLTAVVMIVLLGMVAFAVDVGLMCWTKAELQNAADAGALAGAAKLIRPQVPGSQSQDAAAVQVIAEAKAEAQRFVGYHRAGGVGLTLPAQDVVVGYEAASSRGDVPAWGSGQPYPNAVQVTTRRGQEANGPVGLFFAPALGIKTWSGGATAVAYFKPGNAGVTGFTTTKAPLPKLLPITIDVNFWNTFLATGKSPDGTVHDVFTAKLPTSQQQPPANVSAGGDGVPEFQDGYPNNNSPGNFGLINLRLTNPQNDMPAFSNWILNGPSASDLDSFGASGYQATPAAPVDVKGGPGLKSSLQPDFQAIIGETRAVPLFSSYSGNGSNTFYKVVGFAAVTVVKATGRGSNLEVVLQPMILINPNATTQPGAQTVNGFIYPSTPISLTR